MWYGGAEVPDYVEGSLEVLLVWTATVGYKKQNCGGQVWAGICGELREAAAEGLVRFVASDEELIILVNGCQWCSIDGATRAVRSGERVEVDLGKVVALDYVLCVGFL